MNFNPDTVNWKKLHDPNGVLTLFQPTEAKLSHLRRFMVDSELNLSDENRTPEKVDLLFEYFFTQIPQQVGVIHIFYEIGDFKGLLGLTDILCGYRCNVFLKYWDSGEFTDKMGKEINKFLRIAMKELDLRRIATASADGRAVSIAEKCGFRIEGRQKYAVQYKGELFTNHLLRMIRKLDEKKEN